MRTAFASIVFVTAAVLAGCPGREIVAPADADASSDASIDARTDASDAPGDAITDAGADVISPWLEPWTPAPRAHFPPGFLWGSATAPYQIEGQLHNTDWDQWEHLGHIVANEHADDGPHSLTHYADDVQTLVDTSQNAYRFGIEWARIFPTAAAWAACRDATGGKTTRHATCLAAADPAGVQYYHDVLTALSAHGITPMATLQHFVLPTYVNDLSQDWHSQGWMRDGIVDDLAKWAAFAAAEYGGQVDLWITLNEPTAFAVVAYLDGRHPPGQQLQTDAVQHVAVNMIRAHARMYDAIHLNDELRLTCTMPCSNPVTDGDAAWVSIAHHARRFFGYIPGNARDAMAAARIDQIYNRTFFDAIVNGNLDLDLSGTIDANEPSNDASLAHRADFIGVNYYTTQVVSYNAAVPLLRALPHADSEPRGLPKNDLGWDLYPRGMYDTLMWANSYHLPIMITENGIADHLDVNRPRFLVEHLAAVAAAMQAGASVLGYFHWSTIDNFEWVSGYCPSFGFYAVDRTTEARTRTARPSAMLYRDIIRAGEISDALLAAQPAYQMPTSYCSDRASGM